MYDEIEVKYEADSINEYHLRNFLFGNYRVLEFKHVNDSPDDYYTQGTNVVRHRHEDGHQGELTVKLRKAKRSVRDRKEVDLRFAPETTVADVVSFLKYTGWTKLFTIRKSADIYWVEDKKAVLTVSLYDAYNVESPKITKRFLEIEVEKGTTPTIEEAKVILDTWEKKIESHFDMGTPCTYSLYEYFSGKKYKTSGEK